MLNELVKEDWASSPAHGGDGTAETKDNVEKLLAVCLERHNGDFNSGFLSCLRLVLRSRDGNGTGVFHFRELGSVDDDVVG